ncbi:Putative AC9 transposase, partial [Camponotus floridanus]
YDKNSQRKKDLNRKLAIMIAKDFQLLSIVEDKGFIDFIKALNPRYAIPSRKIMTNSILPECCEIAKQNLKDLLEKVHSVSLTIDGWTSTANESYLGITCHFFELLNSSINL